MIYSKIKYMLATALLATSAVSAAKEKTYDYIEGNYQIINSELVKNINAKGNALNTLGSFSVTPSLAITAGAGLTSFDNYFDYECDVNQFSLGLTGHIPLTQNVDLFGNASVLHARATWQLNDSFYDDDNDLDEEHDDKKSDNGYKISLGLRAMASNDLELEAYIAQGELFDEKIYSFGTAAIYHVNQQLAFGVGYTKDDDDNENTSLIARFAFK